MSNAKYRQPAASPDPLPDVPEALLGQGLNENPAPTADAEDPMPEKLARHLLANAALLMNHLASMCGHAIDAIPGNVADAKFAREVINEAEQLEKRDDTGTGGRIKRAKPHALTNLMRIAISAVRLMTTMLQATNPELFPQKANVISKAFQAQQDAQELAEKCQTEYAT